MACSDAVSTSSRGVRSRTWILGIILPLLLGQPLRAVEPARTYDPARVYDIDTHYVWTYYLALHVGYTPRQAYQIASAAWAIDHDPDTGPMEAGGLAEILPSNLASLTEIAVGAENAWNPQTAEIWRAFHAFARRDLTENPPPDWGGASSLPFVIAQTLGASDVAALAEIMGWASSTGGAVEEARRTRMEVLERLALREGNPGPLIHFVQDYFAHYEFNDLRGHALAGHAPDFLANDRDKAVAMTYATVRVLQDFMRDYLGEEPREPDYAHLLSVLDELVSVNPLPDVLTNLLPHHPAASPSGNAAASVLYRQLSEDEEAGRLPVWEERWYPEVMPLDGSGNRLRGWIPFDFDRNGRIDGFRARVYPVENPRVEVLEPEYEIQERDEETVRLVLRLPFEVVGAAPLDFPGPEYGDRAIPFVERHTLDALDEPRESHRHLTVPRDPPSESRIRDVAEWIAIVPRSELEDGQVVWRWELSIYGAEPETGEVRVGETKDWDALADAIEGRWLEWLPGFGGGYEYPFIEIRSAPCEVGPGPCYFWDRLDVPANSYRLEESRTIPFRSNAGRCRARDPLRTRPPREEGTPRG